MWVWRDGMPTGPPDDVAALERFRSLQPCFGDVLDQFTPHVEPRFVRDDWHEHALTLADALRPEPPDGFLRHPVIQYQMFLGAHHLPFECPYVRRHLPSAELAREDVVGDPPRAALDGLTALSSSNTIHHLHHLLRFEQDTSTPVDAIDTVVEWGAGYGNLAKLFVRLHGGAPTYVLIDLPVFAALQWLYLSSVLGSECVVLHERPGTAVVEHAVNVVPVGLAPFADIEADLFVSTWALNECTSDAQDHVVGRNWFGARSLLLAMHATDPFAAVAEADGARPYPVIDSMPPQRYYVR